MDATLENPGQNGADRLRNSATPQSSRQDAAGANFQELFDDVEDLIKRVADIESPDIQKIRAKVRVALMLAEECRPRRSGAGAAPGAPGSSYDGRLPARLPLASPRARHAARFRRRSADRAKMTGRFG